MKYYIFFDESGLYAYTDSKKTKKVFAENRSKSFKMIAKELSSNDIKLLQDEYPTSLLIWYEFTIHSSGITIKFPITKQEKLDLESVSCKRCILDVYLAAEKLRKLHIYDIVTDEVKKLLEDICLIDCWKYMDKEDTEELFIPDTFSIFLEMYGDTLDWRNYESLFMSANP